MHESLDSISSLSSRKLVALCLLTLYYGHGEVLLAEVSVDVEHTLCLFDSLLCCRVDGVSLLPEKFS